ncbi:MAG: glycerol-3-phosphate dehydrogenase [Pseudomonadota bacterium]
MWRSSYDVVVVGGGINGAGIARDAAGRGLSVLLVEQHDLAAHTSSASSKLIHGGLRYLEHYEFRLVRKALQEREVLLAAAPHLIRPLRLVLPHDAGQRPAWLIRLGLFLYDHLAPRGRLQASGGVDLCRHPAGAGLKPAFRRGFVYSDAWTHDARLVVLNAGAARERGAQIATRTALVGARRAADAWSLDLRTEDGAMRSVQARLVVNAAGPWAGALLAGALGVSGGHRLRLVKGSHIVVPRLFAHDFGYLFQHPDGRVVFALPFEGRFTLIGTTDVDYEGDPAQAVISGAEIDYLCDTVNRYLARPISPAQVVWHFAGVRPLLDDTAHDAARVTRDYRLALDEAGAPVLSVFGGKLTTYRKLAEQAVDRIAPLLGGGAAWTAGAALPGGDIADGDPAAFEARLCRQFPFLAPSLAQRLAGSYGTRALWILDGIDSAAALGEPVVANLYPCELRYLVQHEFARTAEDILWRRSHLGLIVPPEEVARLEAWLQSAGAGVQRAI